MRLESLWYGSNPLSLVLLPVSGLFRLVVAARHFAYRSGLLRSYKLSVPVIVVGNITVGGTGKTPLVIWLVEILRKAGYRPGVVSRGYGGSARTWPQLVDADSDPVVVGDEPVLIAQRTGCPVAVAPRRVAAAQRLLEAHHCDVIISDDGLQHYALRRDIEIAVIDGQRRLGNGRCLPAGPLREGVARLRNVDLIVINGEANRDECEMRLDGSTARSLNDAAQSRDLTAWREGVVHGVAGIGNPGRFFDHLRGHGLRVEEHPFTDHHRYQQAELDFPGEREVIMTEKDAVKCRGFAGARYWYVPVTARFSTDCQRRIEDVLRNSLPRIAVK